MSLNYMKIGRNIKSIRRHRGLSQLELSEQIDRSPAFLSYIETGYKIMSLETFVLLANALHVSADELLVDELSTSIRLTNHRLTDLLDDCNEYEIRVLRDLVISAKRALRSNRSFLNTYHR